MTGIELLFNYIKYGLTSAIMPALVAMISMKLDKKPQIGFIPLRNNE